MASKAKPTGTRRNSSQAKKPATIDLDAKEVKPAAKPADAKASAETKSQNFGRPSTSAKTSTAKSAPPKPEPAKKEETTKSASPKSSSEPQKEPTPPAPAKGSFMGKLTSAFMGGVAALVGFGAIGIWDGARELPIIGNFYGGSQTSSIDPAELSALKAQIAELQNSNTVDLSPVNEKLAALEASVAEISSNSAGSISDEATEKLIQLEQDFAGLNSTLNKITTAAAEGQDTSSIALSTAIASVTKRLDLIETDLGTVATSVSQNPALNEVTKTVASLESNLQGMSETLSSLQETSEANKASLSNLTAQSSDLEDTVASVKASEKVAKSVAVNALATALNNDDALSLPISSIKALIGQTPETSRLEELNSAGIPKNSTLVSDLNQIINTVQNPNAPSKDGTISERFWANARNMVSFRTSGPQEGDTPLAILSRVKAKVEAGSLTDAKTEWETLPANIQESGAAWIGKLNNRIEAFALQNALNQKLTAEAG